MTNIYILKLENNNYYVGKSNDVQKRYIEHLSGNGSSWTKLHKPIEIIKTIPNSSVFEEDKIVKELMSIYGINRVRGGTYNRIELTTQEKNFINKEIWGATDACTRCGRQNHFVKDCYASTDINGNTIYEYDESDESDESDEYDECFWYCEYCKKEYDDKYEYDKHEKCCKKKIAMLQYI